jgi:hypothetical protein
LWDDQKNQFMFVEAVASRRVEAGESPGGGIDGVGANIDP